MSRAAEVSSPPLPLHQSLLPHPSHRILIHPIPSRKEPQPDHPTVTNPPTPHSTPLLQDWLGDDAAKRHRREIHFPGGRFGEAIEQAQAVLFLASDESSFVNGTDFVVDGGLTKVSSPRFRLVVVVIVVIGFPYFRRPLREERRTGGWV